MKNILVVDDDKTFLELIKVAFDAEKFSVATAEDGEEGYKKIEWFKPDIILLDIKMPKMNGIDFLKQMNQKYGAGKIPVIITSNLSTMDKISEGVELGIRAYIVKSNESVKGIVEAVERLLK